MEPISRLDMANTIEWYGKAMDTILGMLPTYTEAHTRPDGSGSPLDQADITALIDRFPEAATKRSVLRYIIAKPATWFHRDSTAEDQKETTNVEEAVSRTAIIPSYCDPSEWTRTGKPQTDIWLYAIPHDSPDVQRIISAVGFAHEYAHSIIDPAAHIVDYMLKTAKEEVDGFDLLMQFANLAKQCPAISHYASTFRNKKGTFEHESLDSSITAIKEELAETIAAHLLGFVFCEDEARRFNPLGDRKDVKELVDMFLQAELIKPS